MSSTCSCAQHVVRLRQQISVMRKEIKNLRHLVDCAVRSHKKSLDSLLSAFNHSERLGVRLNPTPGQKMQDGEGLSLEEGNIQTVPIGYISSCFPGKNGTPRQPGICAQSRATLQIGASIFNNPHHALIGLEHYSHIWVIFLFHKNGHLSCKAKVRPPRLNGQRVGVYSTRSPHRPNSLGLTLAKLECITGDILHLSGIDMIAGTPVLDIKPYIPEYDSPCGRTYFGNTECLEEESTTAGSPTGIKGTTAGSPTEMKNSPADSPTEMEATTAGFPAATKGSPTDSPPDSRGSLWVSHSGGGAELSEEEGRGFGSNMTEEFAGNPAGHTLWTDNVAAALRDVQCYISQSNVLSGGAGGGAAEAVGSGEGGGGADGEKLFEGLHTKHHGRTEVCYSEAPVSQVAAWVRAPLVGSLSVRFTPHAKRDLRQFQPPGKREPGRPSFRFLRGPEEAEAAIRGILCADPRSVYRRTRCPDRLFYFTLDSAHITCWFGGDFAEVVRVRLAEPIPAGPEG